MITRILTALVLLGILSSGALASGALAKESIVSFYSTVTIEDDASLTVEEKITVKAERRQIKRGIVREFPTGYRDRYGNRYRTTFEVESVRRDGQLEDYHTEKRQNGIALYIGRADHLLPKGTYTYQIIYKTSRQIGYFEDFDELYWNVTGNGWRLPIDYAFYRVHLPKHQSAIKIAAFTGSYGSEGTDARLVSETNGLVEIETTRGLATGEGLTVATSFPKGLIYEPDTSDKINTFFRDNIGVFAALLGALGLLGYYLYFWDLKGRDPEGGAIIPRYAPPHGFSPAAARFVSRMSYDRIAFSSAVINMAVKGYLTIAERGRKFTLTRTGRSEARLTSGEQRIAHGLFGGGDSIEMDNENHKEISKAITSFEDGLQSEYQSEYFETNRGYFYGGAVLTLGIMVLAGVLNSGTSEPVIAIIAQIAFGLASGFSAHFIFRWARHRDSGVFDASVSSLRGLLRYARFIIVFLVVLPQFFLSLMVSASFGLALPTVAVILGAINGIFFYLLMAPTRLGRKVQDEIEGFRLYLETAEEDRLNMLNPPEKTPELFEKFLPFALALGVENEWSEKFSSVLSAAAEGGSTYSPVWYTGRHWQPGHVGAFSHSLNSALSSSIASSAHAPGSSSGTGGGGFSGGGGGGGGGGGW